MRDGSAVVLALVLVAPSACAPEAAPVPIRAHTGKLLAECEVPPERRAELEADLALARRAHAAAPHDEDAAIWHGRRLAYLGRYREAIAVFDRALAEHPASYRLLRHRGHRHITVRQLDFALADLERANALIEGVADALEQDGAPNAAGIPRSSSHTNITYHLALAHYLAGDFEAAAEAWRQCAGYATNDDMLCAAAYWLHLALRRLGQNAEARDVLQPIRTDMEILESTSYHRMLLAFKGELALDELEADLEAGSVDRSTVGYGLGAFALVEGRTDEARARFQAVVADGVWPAFGHIAAEAELARDP